VYALPYFPTYRPNVRLPCTRTSYGGAYRRLSGRAEFCNRFCNPFKIKPFFIFPAAPKGLRSLSRRLAEPRPKRPSAFRIFFSKPVGFNKVYAANQNDVSY